MMGAVFRCARNHERRQDRKNALAKSASRVLSGGDSFIIANGSCVSGVRQLYSVKLCINYHSNNMADSCQLVFLTYDMIHSVSYRVPYS